jgi:hypothetical protein
MVDLVDAVVAATVLHVEIADKAGFQQLLKLQEFHRRQSVQC